MRRVLLAVAIAVACVVACGAFEDLPDQQSCREIPEGGCPAPFETEGDPTGNCADPTCSALYACGGDDAGWTLIAKCPPRDAAVDGSHLPEAESPDAHDLRDVAFDVPPGASGGPGCTDLEAPDCPLSLVLACPANQCCCCQDLYVCMDGGWNVWGECKDGGAVVPSEPP